MIGGKPGQALAAALVCVMASIATSARAEPGDYQIQVFEPHVKAGAAAIVLVRLVSKATGNPVRDAVIVATRLDMTPEGMPSMAAKLTPMPGREPGVYQFRANLSMAGRWQLFVRVQLPNETVALESKQIITAVK
jgi:hypothetical protein